MDHISLIALECKMNLCAQKMYVYIFHDIISGEDETAVARRSCL